MHELRQWRIASHFKLHQIPIPVSQEELYNLLRQTTVSLKQNFIFPNDWLYERIVSYQFAGIYILQNQIKPMYDILLISNKRLEKVGLIHVKQEPENKRIVVTPVHAVPIKNTQDFYALGLTNVSITLEWGE